MKKPEDQLQELVNRLREACGENLVSVVLYGSAAREDFHEQFSDVNLLAVFQNLGSESLSHIVAVVRWWTHEQHFSPPLMMTVEELRESADVFAIELLDIQHSHRTVFGEDIVAKVEIPMNLHRVEVEHELRTTLLRLRQHLLLKADDPGELQLVLAKSVSGVLTLFRHALIALGDNPPHSKPELLEHAGRVFGFDIAPLQSILLLRTDPQHTLDAGGTYGAYMNAIATVAHELDVRAPKRHWRKVSHNV
ncbi:MAG: nucleotidyltransferase domain-containing protein [Candidatus Korobacteraceae bacterium]